MDLCNLQLIQKVKWILRKKFYIRHQYLWHFQFLECKKLPDSRNFSGSTSEQSKCPSRVEISPLLKQRVPLLEPCVTPPKFSRFLNEQEVAQNYPHEPNCNLPVRKWQTYRSLYQSLLTANSIMFLVFLYSGLKIFMNRLWLQPFDCCDIIQLYL